MEIKVLGAAGEVGRSAFQVNCDGTNFLLDYGVMFGSPRGSPPTYPLHVKPRDIDSVIITAVICWCLYVNPARVSTYEYGFKSIYRE